MVQPTRNIRSLTIDKDQCQTIAAKLQQLTWTLVRVTDDYARDAVPDPERYRDDYSRMGATCPPLKVNESPHTYIAHEPEHFQYLTPNFLHVKRGQWLVELQIERYQNDCQIENIYNDWKLARRHEIVPAFTKNMGKVSNASNLVAITSVPQQSPLDSHQNFNSTIHLSLPDDETVFRCLIVNIPKLKFHDMRSCLNRDNKYENIKISDKGQNHRGVVSMFINDANEASILTNYFWRRIIRETNNNTNKVYSIDKLISFINDLTQKELDNLIEKMSFSDLGKARLYLKENLKDTIELLVHNGVLQQVHSWRCAYCGNNNKRSMDTLKLENACDICQETYQAPIDMEWKYLVSPFVVASLAKHNGLTVLWGIATLLKKSDLRQSIYLPEADLYRVYDDEDQKNEIDIIALIDGEFIVAEVKLSAASFIESTRETDTFIDELTRIQPDIAYLIFEQYCSNDEDVPEIKERLDNLIEELKTRTPISTELIVIIATTYPEFSSVPMALGPYGKRTHKMLDSL